MSMRLLFLSHYFPPEGNAPASRIHALCKRWVQAGHDVTVITCAPNVPNGVVYPGYKNKLWQKESIDGIQTIRVWTFLAPNKGTIRRTLNYISFMLSVTLAACFVSKPDLVLATSPQFFNGWAGVLVSKIRRLRFVLEIRDIWPESIEAVGAIGNRFALRGLGWLEHRMYAAAHQIVTVGEGYKHKLIERGVAAAKIGIVPNGVDRDRFVPCAEPVGLREKLGLEGAFVCSYIGTVGMAAGLEVVLRAASKVKALNRRDIKFLIVGDGAALEDLRVRAKQEGLDSVVFAGRQPKEMIPQCLAASDACFVHLRKQALFTTVMPSKIFEAMAMERPVILGVEGFAADFVRKSGGGICVEPENEDDLLRAIDQLRNNADLGGQLGRAGHRYVLERFDRDVLAVEYLTILRRVAGPTSPSSRPTEPTSSYPM